MFGVKTYVLKMLMNVYTFIVRVQERRVAYWQLQNMTDKELHDIGITRGEIYSRLRG